MGFSLGEWLQTASWDIQAFFGNEDAKIHAESLRTVNRQRTEEDRLIYTTVESQVIHHEGVLGGLDEIGDATRGLFNERGLIGGFWKNFTSMFKSLPWIVLVIAIAIGGIYFWPQLRKLKKGG